MSLRTHAFTGDGAIAPANLDNEVWGISYTGFTAVSVFNGADATGALIFAGGAGPVTFAFPEGVEANAGIFVDTTGSGSGSLLF